MCWRSRPLGCLLSPTRRKPHRTASPPRHANHAHRGRECLRLIGLVLLSLGRSVGTVRERRKCYGLAAWFLVSAPLQFLGGYLDMTIDRSAPPRT